jgi:acetyl esterase/lipase
MKPDQTLLDIYLPANTKSKLPLVILVHGGGWLINEGHILYREVMSQTSYNSDSSLKY